MIGQNMQPSPSQHQNVLVSLVGLTNQDAPSRGPTQTSCIKLNCSKCRFTTKDRDSFERHWAQHAGVTFTCIICGHVSYTRVESQRHTVQHSGKFPFRCEFCSYGAVRRDYVAKHVQRVHSKNVRNIFAGNILGPSQNVVIMGDVSIASVAEVGQPTLINATEQATKPPMQPLNIVPNLIPLTLNQPQGTNTAPTSYHFGGGLNKSVGIMPNKFLNPQCQNVNVPAHRDTLSTNLNSAGPPSQLISIAPVRIPNATNHTNISVTNSRLSSVNQQKYDGSKVLTTVNQSTSIASDVMSIIPRQSAHTTANISNTVKHPPRRAPPIILRKTQQRPTGSAPVNKCLPAGSQVISSAGKVPTSSSRSSVASNTLSVFPGQAINLAIPGSTDTPNPSSFRTPSNTTQKAHQGSTGMVAKPLCVSNGPTSVLLSNRVPYSGSQAFAGAVDNSPVSVFKTVRPTLGAVPSQPEKRVCFASESGSVGSLSNRFGSTVGKSLSVQSRAMERQMGSKPTATSLQSIGPLGNSGNSLFDKTSKQGLCAPVQVELLEPLNQPIYEQTLTVSYPEEINIPPGSLVELVNMNTVNGAQELQLRILPQQSVRCSEKNAPETAPAVCTAFKDGTATVDQSLSREKRHSNAQACPKTDACQAPPVANAEISEILRIPNTRISTCSEMRVTVKEEPPEHDSVLTLSQELNKAHQSVANPVSQALPTIGITIRKKDHIYSSTSLTGPCSQNRIPVTSNPQNPKSGGSIKGCNASATPTVTNGDYDIEMEREGLPVILSVYSLGDNAENEQLLPLVERRLLHGNSANSHGTRTPAEDRVDALLVPCPPSETLRQLLRKKGNCVEPPVQKRTVNIPGDEKHRLLQESKLQPPTGERHACEPETQTSVNRRQNDVDSSGSVVGPTVHRRVEAHPPPLLPQRCLSPDPDAKERTICGVRISGFSPLSYKQLFTLVPRVSLARISDSCPQPATTDRKSDKHTGHITLSANPVLSCASNKQNISIHCHEVLKLRLKRKKCETEDNSSDIFEAFALPLTEANAEPFGVSDGRKRKDRVSGKRRKLSGAGNSHRLYLTPVKEDQPVKWPSPNQPVVVLNHPHPHVLRWGGGRSPQSPADGRGVAPLRIVFFRDTHKVVTELVRSPSLKMKFKKVDGDQYQVTELLAEGISNKLDL